eukprot:45512-Eustigmatos_ZCMA.PRE.1
MSSRRLVLNPMQPNEQYFKLQVHTDQEIASSEKLWSTASTPSSSYSSCREGREVGSHVGVYTLRADTLSMSAKAFYW